VGSGQQVRGLLAPPPSGGLLHGDAMAASGPHRWLATRIDPQAIARALNLSAGVAPRALRLDPARNRGDAGVMLVPGVRDLVFMRGGPFEWNGVPLWISRSGYTGEDGFEISVPGSAVVALADALTEHELVKPIGLGARDSLRLEAGLPLYGHDLGLETTPVMAGLNFAINKRRRAEGGFPGAMRILAEIENGALQQRVGFDVEGRQPVREGALVLDGEGNELGRVTSGGFSPTLQRPIAMAYVATPFAAVGTALKLEQRGKLFDARVAEMPFVPHRYHRKGAA
jgi:aminomethyltransferase